MRALKSQAGRGKLADLRRTIEDSGGRQYAQDRMDHYSQRALLALKDFPASPYKAALGNVVDFNTQRTW